LEHFQGTLCHDHWKPYFQFNCLHALCNAHHVRELERAWEQAGQRWATKMQYLLLEMNDATLKAGGVPERKSRSQIAQPLSKCFDPRRQ
jgi:transposase